ncbi:hypothetical protein GS646_07855 [Ruegeria sp. HKCCD4315]|nr:MULTISPECIES: hypothetical protein [unclassified Ruegeria]NOD87410.1 hypothetical protein [Ruegeria sp. HKCCD4318]NOE12965.1 hypothetical protein [Ruegeria sp. HKCCD4318-2]NOG08868.1 hypothetical protein [Ruegeria sp. HKCCD4315]
MMIDSGYVNWLLQQGWFAERNQAMYEHLTGENYGGAKVENTPEHNRLQALFLNPEYCLSVGRCAGVVTGVQYTREQHDERMDNVRLDIKDWSTYFDQLDQYEAGLIKLRPNKPFYGDNTPVREWLGTAELHFPTFEEVMAGFSINCTMQFETADIDVIAQWHVYHDNSVTNLANLGGLNFLENHWFGSGLFCVEIKPTLGDDYPNVLRDMQRGRKRAIKHVHGSYVPMYEQGPNQIPHILYVERFTATSVSFQQVEQMFAHSGFRIVMRHEVDALSIMPPAADALAALLS